MIFALHRLPVDGWCIIQRTDRQTIMLGPCKFISLSMSLPTISVLWFHVYSFDSLYLSSKCTCDSGKVCARASDDISIATYNYMCMSMREAKGLDILKELADSEIRLYNSYRNEATGMMSPDDTNGDWHDHWTARSTRYVHVHMYVSRRWMNGEC